MTKKNIYLIVLVLLLGGLSLCLNRDRFKGEPIQISHRSMPPRGAPLPRGYSEAAAAAPVVFIFNKELRITAVKVVLASDTATNKHPDALWELVSPSRSAPVKEFIYGMNIPGMRPAVKGAVADPLQPGVKYRLVIKAGSHKAEHDFTPLPR